MSYTRREFGKLASGRSARGGACSGEPSRIFGAFAQAKPNSLINGVQIGTITYSYRSMPDQSAEATLKYILDSGISAIELMGGPVESFAGAPASAGRAAVAADAGPRAELGGRGLAAVAGGRSGRRCSGEPPRGAAPVGSWNGQPCPAGVAAAPRARRRRRRRGRGEIDARAAGGAAGTGREAEGLAHERLDGRVQEAAQDVQRRRRDDLRLEAAQPEHVGRGVRLHLQRRRSARLHAHDARAADRRRAAEADRRLRDEAQDLRGVSHAHCRAA